MTTDVATTGVNAPTLAQPLAQASILKNRRAHQLPYRGVSIVQQDTDEHAPSVSGVTRHHTWVVMPTADVRVASGLHPHTKKDRLRRTLNLPSRLAPSARRDGDTKPSEDTQIDDSPMDPLELADLNSIINTRKSMAVAQALANQEHALDEHEAACTSSGLAAGRRSRRLVHFAPLPQVEEQEDAAVGDEETGSTPSTAPEDSLPERRSSTSSSLWLPSISRHERSDDEPRGRSLVRAWSPFRRHHSRDASSSPSRSLSRSNSFAEERSRCRELVRATRPGGTGMVTLLDGKRIPARQVGDASGKDDDAALHPSLWGFAALERRRELPASTSPTSSQRTRAKLSTEQAQEVQRRYKQEMDELGVEVLSHVRDKSHHTRARNLSGTPTHKIHVDPTVSMPSPSPRLPRRPDAKGIAVVPLSELGMRPRYPREGRSCIYNLPCDDMDTSGACDDDDEEREHESHRHPTRRRATTRAAGQEVYMSHKPRRDDWDDEYWPRPSATRSIEWHAHSGAP